MHFVSIKYISIDLWFNLSSGTSAQFVDAISFLGQPRKKMIANILSTTLCLRTISVAFM